LLVQAELQLSPFFTLIAATDYTNLRGCTCAPMLPCNQSYKVVNARGGYLHQRAFDFSSFSS
jgi:hypothetical protein